MLDKYIGPGKWEEFFLEDKKRYEYYEHNISVPVQFIYAIPPLNPELLILYYGDTEKEAWEFAVHEWESLEPWEQECRLSVIV